MAVDCFELAIKSVIGKIVPSKPYATLESKRGVAVANTDKNKMAPCVSSKKVGPFSTPDIASKKKAAPLSNLQIKNGSHGKSKIV
jgi:hypothetical protein